jgi:S1-C subfamily serine protease
MTRQFVRLIGLCAAAMVVMSDHALAAGLKINVPPPIAVPELPAGTKVQPVSLTRIAANIAPGTAWLEETAGLACLVSQTTYWKESNNRVGLSSFERVFRDQMASVGFNAGKDPSNLFEEHSASDLQVGALITGIAIKSCLNITQTKVGVTGAMDVEWQIYSVTKGAVIARTTTHGGYSGSVEGFGNISPAITALFGDNVRRLAADPGFRELVTATATAPTTPPVVTQISFAPATAALPVAKAAQGVVTIFAGDAWGSGILISADGYILTNHHVAAAGDRARIRWSDGTETSGEVLRSDKRRDVALIRTTGRPTPLAIRHDAAQLGEPVFAIGTPLEKTFQNTVTRGVVSGVRNLEGQSFIQSDVAVDHGNSGGPLLDEQGRVIGITDWGYSPDGVSHNLNFFIPIDDALRVLALSPVPAVDPRPAAAPHRPAARKR